MSKRITRTPLYNALQKHQVTLALATGLLTAIPVCADPNTKIEWDCRPDNTGQGWSCVEHVVPGKQYQRPVQFLTSKVQKSSDSVPKNETAASASREPNALAPVQNLDWVESEALTPEQRKNISSGCCGAYAAPERTDKEAKTNPDEATIDITADTTETIGDITTMEGDVQITQGYRRLRSDKAILDQQTRTVELEGDIQLREPDMLLVGDSAHIEADTNIIDIDNATFVFSENNIRGTADQLSRSADNNFLATGATYTSCPPDSNDWSIVASTLKINNESEFATAKHVRLNVKDIPIIYLPYLVFPVFDERKSGLLFPTFEISDTNGFDFAQPYYLNLAPNYDATITARYLEDRGEMVATEFRHLSDWGYTVLNGAYLGDDDGGSPNDDDYPTYRSYGGEDRWLGNIEHNGGFNNFTTRIDYTKVSDDDYFQDLGDSTLAVNSQTHLLQLAEIGYSMEHWDFNLKAEQYQTIFSEGNRNEEKPYKQLPRFDANGLYQFNNGINVSLQQHIVAFDHDDDRDAPFYSRDDMGDYITGQRVGLSWGMEWDKQWTSGYLTPGVIGKHIGYSLDDSLKNNSDDSPSVTVPVAYIDSGLFLERDTTWIDGLTQTFEPRLYALYSDYQDQGSQPDFDTSETTFSYNSLFRDNRFTGGDRIGDTQQISLGFTSRLLDQTTGQEILQARIGQSYYFDDRKVSLNPMLTPDVIENPEQLSPRANQKTINELESLRSNKSPIAGDLTWSLTKHIKMVSNVTWNTDRSEVDRGGLAVRYNHNKTLINVGYNYTRENAIYSRDYDGLERFIDQDVEETNFSTIFPLTDSLRAIAHWNYDLTNERNLENFIGFEYDNCCWKISLIGRKWIERDDYRDNPQEDLEEDTGVFFQIQLKGLANSGGRVDNILSDGIYGYTPAGN